MLSLCFSVVVTIFVSVDASQMVRKNHIALHKFDAREAGLGDLYDFMIFWTLYHFISSPELKAHKVSL